VTDPFLHSMVSHVVMPGVSQKTVYLQTSPEYAMKRLLAAGSGPIYQLCKAFRNEESGRQHNPEFTMLEWYRPGFDHHDLMTEMDAFLQCILKTEKAERLTYRDAFREYASIDPHTASVAELQTCAALHDIIFSSTEQLVTRDDWLYLLISHLIEPKLGQTRPTFLYDFPASQAALARILPGDPLVAARFEVYVQGVELANGYYELANAEEQQQRFDADLKKRALLQNVSIAPDQRLLAALAEGFPDCAGVALGVDRLVMLATGADSISDVISFPIDCA
jgi:elongation factor P--(R)-beta-lysine ligase